MGLPDIGFDLILNKVKKQRILINDWDLKYA